MTARGRRGTEWSSPMLTATSPPDERTWRDLLSDALDNFALPRSRSRSPSPIAGPRGAHKPKVLARAINGSGSAAATPVTSPSGTGWLLRNTDRTDVVEASDEPPCPSFEQEEGEALQNELNAQRAQMDAIASAARGYTPHQIVPPRAPVDVTPAKPESPNAASSSESEEFFARPCSTCALSSSCEWSAHSSQWRSQAKVAVWSEHGVPSSHRAQLWLACMGLDTAEARTAWTNYYAALLSHAAAITTEPDASASSSSSADGAHPSQPHPRAQFSSIAFKEVLKDVERTLPTMAMFSASNGPGQRSLQRLLLAFSLHRPLVGYCQGLGFVAATVLLVFSGHSEALAFGMLCTLLEQRLAYYVKSMLGCVQDARVLRDLLGFYDPDLASLFAKHQVSVEHFSASWLLCFFVGSPLPLHHAVRVFDLVCLYGQHVLHLVGLGLFHVHRSSFLSISRPTAEQLMNVLTRIVGTTTDMPTLMADVREKLEAPHLAGFDGTLRTMRRFQRHELVREFATLQPSRLRRLERATGLHADELQRLWTAFISSSDNAWSTHVSGAINDVLHFRLALAAAVFPGPSTSSSGSSSTSSLDYDSTPSEAMRWKGCGVVDAGPNSAPGRCVVCVPPLPASTHLDAGCGVMSACPRCSWALARPTPTGPAAWLAPPSACTCACACLVRGVTLAGSVAASSSPSSPASTGSVFHRLFHFFDASSEASARGFLDFESFAAACRLFLHSDRVARLQAVFRLAGGRDPAEAPRGPGAPATEAGIQRGRVCRSEFEGFVAAFEELYHGHSFVNLPQGPSPPPPSLASTPGAALRLRSVSSSPPPLPPIRLASSVASARMFVDMAFEKERAASPSSSGGGGGLGALRLDGDIDDDVEDMIPFDEQELPASVPSSLLNPSSPTDSLSYESFASFIVLHPLISAFFRLDSIVD